MAYHRRKPKVGFSSDVEWYIPKRKTPIATSTKATSDCLKYFVGSGFDTPNKIVGAIREGIFIGGQEEKLIMQAYIDKGYGDLELRIR